MTPEAAFGYQRSGTPAALGALGQSRGFEVVVVPPFEIDGRAVSSSQVRAAIAAGDLGGAARLLGRPHAVVGRAAEAGQGSVLRFSLPVALPPDGTYRVSLAPGSTGVPDDASGHPADALVRAGAIDLPDGHVEGRIRVAFGVGGRGM